MVGVADRVCRRSYNVAIFRYMGIGLWQESYKGVIILRDMAIFVFVAYRCAHISGIGGRLNRDLFAFASFSFPEDNLRICR